MQLKRYELCCGLTDQVENQSVISYFATLEYTFWGLQDIHALFLNGSLHFVLKNVFSF